MITQENRLEFRKLVYLGLLKTASFVPEKTIETAKQDYEETLQIVLESRKAGK